MKKFIFEDEAEDLDILAEDDLDLVEDEEVEQVNEVRYIDPDNLDNYDKDEIEEVTTASGEKRYKRKTGAQAPVEKKEEPANQQKFSKDSARDYAKEFYRSIYGPNRNDSPYKDKKLDYTDELRDTANWPDSVADIFDHQHNLLSTLYVQDQYASNDEEHKKYRQQYNSVFDDAAKAMKNVDEKERFKAINDYYNNRYQSGGYASDPDGWRTSQVKSILQSFGYDVNGKKDMRNAYKELKAKLS